MIYALVAAFRARLMFIALACVAGLGGAILLKVVLPDVYESTAIVQVDSREQNPLTGYFEPRLRVQEFLGQQAAFARSRVVALSVYDRLIADGVLPVDAYRDEWRRAIGGVVQPGVDLRTWVADGFLERLTVTPVPKDGSLEIAFRSESPVLSARIANAFADAYMSEAVQRRRLQAGEKASQLRAETEALKTEVEAAQSALASFRRRYGIVFDGVDHLEDVEHDLEAATQQLALARTTLAAADALARRARDADMEELLTMPMPEGAAAGSQAQERLGILRVEIDRLSRRYGEAYTPLKDARFEAGQLAETIRHAVKDYAEVTASHVTALETQVDQGKDAVVSLQALRSRYDLLAKQRDARRQTFEFAMARTREEVIQSKVDTIDVFMLGRASPAQDPAGPPSVLILALGAFLGAGFGFLGAAALEVIEARVRAPQPFARLLRVERVFVVPTPQLRGGAS